MPLPFGLKLSTRRWPQLVEGLVRRWADPQDLAEGSPRYEFSKYMESLNPGGVRKTTSRNRHPLANEIIIGHGGSDFLDIGVSDGITALELIEALEDSFESYTLTDRVFDTHMVRSKRTAFFYDSIDGRCFLVSNNWFLIDPTRWPFTSIKPGWRAKTLIDWNVADVQPVSLVNPSVRHRIESDPRVQLKTYDVLTPWPGPQVDTVKIANLLNPCYFSVDQIKTIAWNLAAIVRPGGILVVVHNLGQEKVSVFHKSDSSELTLSESIHGGVEAEATIVEAFASPEFAS